MKQFVLHHTDGTSFTLVNREHVCCPTSATQSQELNGTDTVEMTVVSASPLTFYIGDYISLFNHIYVLNQQPTVAKAGKREFQYTLKFESVQYELLDVLWFLPQAEGSDNDYAHDGLTTDLKGFLDNLIWNANRNHNTAVWQLGDYPDDITDVKTLSYEEQNCLSVLQNLCEEYKVNFRIDEVTGNRVLNVFKNDTDASSLLDFTFSYGRAGGAYKIERTNIDDKGIVTRLYCYGGSENLGSNYGAPKLCLPASSQSLVSHKNRSQSYLQASASLVEKFGIRENILNLDDIYPQAKFTVGARISQRVLHANIGFDINQYLIAGTEVQLTPQTGNCAGYEFGVNKVEYDSTKPYSGCDSKITINTITDENGYVFPSANAGQAFSIAAGDEFLVSGISLPNEYIIAAQNKLQGEGEKYLAEYCIPHVQYAIEIDRNYMKQRLAAMSTSEPFKVGLFVTINDEDLGIDNIATQITAISRDLIDEYKFKITLGESSAKSNLQRIVGDLKKVTQKAIVLDQTDAELARLNYQAKQELMQTIFDTEQDIYTEGITPLSVQTAALQVGANSRQFSLKNFTLQPNYNTGANEAYHNKVYWAAGAILTHQTILDSQGNMRVWTLSGNSVATLTANSPYNIYAVCSKNGNTGSILLSTDQIRYDGFNYNTETEDNSNYYFLIGQLSSPLSGRGGKQTRIASMTYGSTTINGSFIRTGRLSANNGNTYFDLDTGEISSASPIKFTYKGTSNTDLDTLLQTINDTSSTANTNATNAQNTASTASSNASAALTAANGANSTANSALSTANTASSNASTALNKVNNLKIGGTNLIRQSNVAIMNLISETNPVSKSSPVMYLSQSIPSGTYITISLHIQAVNVQWSSQESYHRAGMEFNSGSTPNYYFGVWFTHTGNFNARLTQTFQLSVDVDKSRPIYLYIQNLASGYIIVSNPQVEIGTIATDWSLAQGDIIGRNLAKKEFSGFKRADIITQNYGVEITTPNVDTYFTIPTHSQLEKKRTYCLSCYVEGMDAGNFYKFGIFNQNNGTRLDRDYLTIQNGFCYCLFHGFDITSIFLDDQSRNMQQTTHIKISNIKIELGSIATDWSPAPEDIDEDINALANRAIFSALQDSTDISGGLVLTNAIFLKAAGGAINSGISGLNATTAGKNPRFWAGGNYTDALNAAADSSMDVPNRTLPILLTDQGYNSNIGIFKVLDGAIAVMRNGQVVRISTAAFSTEQTNYAPVAPFTHTLSSGGRLNFTSTSTSQASHTRDFTGLFSKTANYNITIAQTSVTLSLYENRNTYFSGSCTVTLSITLQIKAGNKTQTIYTGSINRTQTVTNGGSTTFSNSGTLTVPASSVNNVQITSGNRIQLIATISSSATGSTTPTSRSDYYELAAQMVATNSENNSCFILANGGFECAYSATKALFFNAINGLFSFQGSNFQINGKDFAVDKTKTVTLGSGSLIIQRIGFLVTMKITIPKAYLGSGVIPTGYRPSIATTVLVCTAAADGTVYQLDISTLGGMTCGSLPNNTIAYGSATYICTESYPS